MLDILSKSKRKVKLTKKKMIEDHSKSGKSLTQWECTMLYRHLRLSAVIYDLRNQGWDIATIMEKNTNDDGEHARYVLIGVGK